MKMLIHTHTRWGMFKRNPKKIYYRYEHATPFVPPYKWVVEVAYPAPNEIPAAPLGYSQWREEVVEMQIREDEITDVNPTKRT